MSRTMDTSSINPASIIDEAVDLSMRLAGTDFPVSIFPTKIQRIISEVHECHNYPTDYIASAIFAAIAVGIGNTHLAQIKHCLLYTSPSPRDRTRSRMPSSA